MRPLRILALAALVTGAAACNKSEPPAPSAAPAAPLEQKPAEPAPVKASPSVEDNTFKLALVGEPEYSAGAPGKLKLTLEARGGYHVNQEYPMKVLVKAAGGVTLPKSNLAKADASEFGEHKVSFELPFTAESGSRDVSADVDFAVCTAETCVPDQRTVVLSLNVK